MLRQKSRNIIKFADGVIKTLRMTRKFATYSKHPAEPQEESGSKQRMIVLKGHEIAKRDYRGVVAILVVGSFLYSVLLSGICYQSTTLGPFAGAIVGYYFRSKQGS